MLKCFALYSPKGVRYRWSRAAQEDRPQESLGSDKHHLSGVRTRDHARWDSTELTLIERMICQKWGRKEFYVLLSATHRENSSRTISGRPGEAVDQICYQQPSRRRTRPPSPSKPVPKSVSEPGSGTTLDPVLANPVLEQPSPPRTQT